MACSERYLIRRAAGEHQGNTGWFTGPFRVFPGLSGSLSGSFRAQSTRKRPGAFPGPFRVFRVFREARGIPGGPESGGALRASRNSPQVIICSEGRRQHQGEVQSNGDANTKATPVSISNGR